MQSQEIFLRSKDRESQFRPTRRLECAAVGECDILDNDGYIVMKPEEWTISPRLRKLPFRVDKWCITRIVSNLNSPCGVVGVPGIRRRLPSLGAESMWRAGNDSNVTWQHCSRKRFRGRNLGRWLCYETWNIESRRTSNNTSAPLHKSQWSLLLLSFHLCWVEEMIWQV